MSLFLFEIFRNWYTCIPILFPEPKMVRIDKVINLLFDGFRVEGNVVFREELLLLIIVDFIIFYGAYLRLACLFGSEKFVQILLLS